jgi:hypothetical protein
MLHRELTRADARTLAALQKAITNAVENGDSDGRNLEVGGKNFNMLPLHQKVRFKGADWQVDCPTKFEAGKTHSFVTGNQESFELDLMLLKMYLNIAEGGF